MTIRINHNRSFAMKRSVINYWGLKQVLRSPKVLLWFINVQVIRSSWRTSNSSKDQNSKHIKHRIKWFEKNCLRKFVSLTFQNKHWYAWWKSQDKMNAQIAYHSDKDLQIYAIHFPPVKLPGDPSVSLSVAMATQLWCHSTSAKACSVCHAREFFILHTSANFVISNTQIFWNK